MSNKFQLITEMSPQGDQPQAIKKLVYGLSQGMEYQTLLGVTGSGKTFTMAHIIEAVQRPALIISHNKVLAAQLYSEFKQFFPHNAVEYFVSYYDYYQPEAYVPSKDIYIEKEVEINEEIDRMRLSATTSLLQRQDVIVVASVSCIYGLGSPEDYRNMIIELEIGQKIIREKLLRKLVELQYKRNDMDLGRGTFRVRGDVIDIIPSYEQAPVRIELFGNTIDRMCFFDAVTGHSGENINKTVIYPAKHFVTPEDKLKSALKNIREELRERLNELRNQDKLLEAQRLEQRTLFDLEMLETIGYCSGIENYSRHLSGRGPGERPYTLIDYFPDDFLLFIDESHVMVPQLHGMYGGDRTRKQTLVDFGFRLPSALDNRPLRFSEFMQLANQIIFVSATPADYEINISEQVVEQIIRPTGLVDPEIILQPAQGQVDDLIDRIRERVEKKERVLVTTLTRRMAEDLSDYLSQLEIKVRYLHFEIDTLERADILHKLRQGDFDVLVGVNLLREGLDLPEVTLVAIMDADREGFLRSKTSLIQVCGRAARNVNGQVVMYADQITDSIQEAVKETNRRREIQLEYNRQHNLTPQTIKKEVRQLLEYTSKKEADKIVSYVYRQGWESNQSPAKLIDDLRKEMLAAARNLEFERAALIRDHIAEITKANPLLAKKSKKKFYSTS